MYRHFDDNEPMHHTPSDDNFFTFHERMIFLMIPFVIATMAFTSFIILEQQPFEVEPTPTRPSSTNNAIVGEEAIARIEDRYNLTMPASARDVSYSLRVAALSTQVRIQLTLDPADVAPFLDATGYSTNPNMQYITPDSDNYAEFADPDEGAIYRYVPLNGGRSRRVRIDANDPEATVITITAS